MKNAKKDIGEQNKREKRQWMEAKKEIHSLYEKDYENLKIQLSKMGEELRLLEQQQTLTSEQLLLGLRDELKTFKGMVISKEEFSKEQNDLHRTINMLKSNLASQSATFFSKQSFEIFKKKN